MPRKDDENYHKESRAAVNSTPLATLPPLSRLSQVINNKLAEGYVFVLLQVFAHHVDYILCDVCAQVWRQQLAKEDHHHTLHCEIFSSPSLILSRMDKLKNFSFLPRPNSSQIGPNGAVSDATGGSK